jgi:GNAT superfamily N-acetyltransferase
MPDTLPDPNVVTVRSVRQDDVALIWEMHERLSDDSVYYRYLGANKPSSEDLVQLCSLDENTGTVLVATVHKPEEKVVGIACYRLNHQEPTAAEPAILVEDHYQGYGLGKKLVISLCQNAVQNGVERFDTFIHPANFRVVQMIKKSGLYFECKYRDRLKEIRVWLIPRN